MSDDRTAVFTAKLGRDAGKAFQLTEVDTLLMAGFVLRLVAALRVESYEALLGRLKKYEEAGANVEPPIDDIMRLLQGSEPKQVETLIHEALESVQIAPDPKHPGAFRKLEAKDIRELGTLGEVLVAFIKLNFSSGV